MLSNEELAVLIQQGHKELEPELWEQIRRFVKMQAEKRLSLVETTHGVEVDDLIQSGYLAMVRTCEKYDPQNGAFLTYMDFYLKAAFAEVLGYRKRHRDPLDYAQSLDAPIGGEDDDFCLVDTVAAQDDDFAESEDSIYIIQLRAALDSLIRRIPNTEGQLIRENYLDHLPLSEIARRRGCSRGYLANVKRRGLYLLRCKAYGTEEGRNLYSFLRDDVSEYTRVSASSFQRTGTSSVELNVFAKDRFSVQAIEGEEI